MPRHAIKFVLGLVLAVVTVGAQAQDASLRIGVFDPELLWKETEVGRKYNQELSATRDRLQSEIDNKQDDLEALKSRLRQQQASLNEIRIQQMQKEILDKRTELDRMNEDATKEMKFQLGEVQTRFQEMLIETIETFGKEQQLTLILNRGVIDYSAPTADITSALIAKFNELHKAPPASAANTGPPGAPGRTTGRPNR